MAAVWAASALCTIKPGTGLRGQSTAHDLPTMQVQHDGQIQPAFYGVDRGDISGSYPIKFCLSKASLYVVPLAACDDYLYSHPE